MFGAEKGVKDEAYIEKWWECLTDFVVEEKYSGAVVEVDCQKVLGPKKAVELRRRMRDKLPNRIINVFHLEDGQRGLDEMIEFSDYMAISVPELRFAGKKDQTEKIAHYIKNKKPEIDIHLLGCTERKMLRRLAFCSSADSSSWISAVRYGEVKISAGSAHVKNLKESVIFENYQKWLMVKEQIFPKVKNPKNIFVSGALTFLASEHKREYEKYAGRQD
jgi:hypothetical protein